MTVPLITLAAALVAPPNIDANQPPVLAPAAEHRAESPWKIGLVGGPMAGGTAIALMGLYGFGGYGGAFSLHALNHRWHSFAAGSFVPHTNDDRGAVSSFTTGTGVRLDTDRHGPAGLIVDFDGAIGAAMLGSKFTHLGLGYRIAPGARFSDNWTLQASWILTTSIITWQSEVGLNLGYTF